MATKGSSSDNDFDFAGNTTSSPDIEDDFDWADDELPATAPPAQDGSVTAKPGPIPFKTASTSSTPPAASSAAGQAGSTAGPPVVAKMPAPQATVPAASAQPRTGPVGAQKAGAPSSTAPQGAPTGPQTVAPAKASTAGTPQPAASSAGPTAAASTRAPPARPAGAPTAAQPKPPLVKPPVNPADTAQPAATPAPTAAAAATATQPARLAQRPAPGTATPAASTLSAGQPTAAPPATPAVVQSAAATAAATAAVGAAAATGASSATAAATHAANAEITAAADADTAAAAEDGGSSAGEDGSSKGWGGWLAPAGLGGLSSKLQKVALGAAKDLQELTASVQQVVAEVVAADDITEVDRLAEYQARPVGQQARDAAASGPGAAPPAPVMASRDSSSQLGGAAAGGKAVTVGAGDAAGVVAAGGAEAASSSQEQDPEVARRQEVLQRLQGKDTQLESGLRVIDDQVDALAANAAKALGSLWGGLNTVAKTSWGFTAAITTKVEAAAKEMAKELAVGLEEGASLAARAEKGLESVLGPRGTSGGGSQRSAADWESTFESCFELFGGLTATEELEELSSECAHICNSARAKLQQQQREQIDAMLTKLVPLFDPAAVLQQQQEQGGQNSHAAAAAAGVDEATLDALDALYAPVIALCNKGKKKAGQLQTSAATAAAAAAESVPSPRHQQQQEQQQPGSSAGSQAAAEEAARRLLLHQQQEVCAVLQEVLQGVRSAAVKSLAEVAAGQIMVLLTLGRSIAALPRYGKPLADGLEWPAESDAMGALIRSQVQHMVTDTRDVAAAFSAAAAHVAAQMPRSTTQPAVAAAAAADEAAGGEADAQGDSEMPQQQLQQRAAAAGSEVDADCQLALSHVRDSYGKLLYVVLLASLHRAGRDGPEQQEQEQPPTAVQPATQASNDFGAELAGAAEPSS